METSAAVPSRTEIIERGLAELSDEDIEHLGEVMTRSWLRSNRIGVVAVMIPLGSCTALAATGSATLIGLAVMVGSIGLLVGGLANGIADALFRRSLALEVVSLGYQDAVGRAVGDAWVRANRSFLPRFTRLKKRDACRKQLMRARDGAAPRR